MDEHVLAEAVTAVYKYVLAVARIRIQKMRRRRPSAGRWRCRWRSCGRGRPVPGATAGQARQANEKS